MTDQPSDPFSLFQRLFDEAQRSEPEDAEAMALATADEQGRPSLRMVLLKGVDGGGFVFYTNSESRKG
jgi:pyridoxamine 5'-phosphate oxidase